MFYSLSSLAFDLFLIVSLSFPNKERIIDNKEISGNQTENSKTNETCMLNELRS